MKKSKILGLKNKKDSLWFTIEAGMESLNCLDEIFNIYDKCNNNRPNNYKEWIKKMPTEFFIDESHLISYIILCQNKIHLILRKFEKYVEVNDKIKEYFEFK